MCDIGLMQPYIRLAPAGSMQTCSSRQYVVSVSSAQISNFLNSTGIES